MGLYQKLWQNLGGLHQFVFYFPMPSYSHGLSLLNETPNTVLTEIHVASDGYCHVYVDASICCLQ